MHMQKTLQVQLFLGVLILGFLTGPHVIKALERLAPPSDKPAATIQTAAVVNATNTEQTIAVKNPFQNLELYAKSAYVWDINARQKLYSLNGDTSLPLASVTKIMTALAAYDSFPPQTKITITSSDLMMEGDTGLNVGEIWTLEKLLQFSLVASSNDGASAIAATLGGFMNAPTSTNWSLNKTRFIEQMNEKAHTIRLVQTTFQNESGLDGEGGVSGAYGSARDMAMLFEYVLRKHPKIFTATAYPELDLRSEDNIMHHVANTNQGVAHIVGIIGSKTGYTDLAGGNLVVIVDIGIDHPVVIAVLGSTREGRFTDVEQLIAATTKTITRATN
jgi:D-alanyl-D-alanine carboxypeptidase